MSAGLLRQQTRMVVSNRRRPSSNVKTLGTASQARLGGVRERVVG
jgi:hypothetical protein